MQMILSRYKGKEIWGFFSKLMEKPQRFSQIHDGQGFPNLWHCWPLWNVILLLSCLAASESLLFSPTLTAFGLPLHHLFFRHKSQIHWVWYTISIHTTTFRQNNTNAMKIQTQYYLALSSCQIIHWIEVKVFSSLGNWNYLTTLSKAFLFPGEFSTHKDGDQIIFTESVCKRDPLFATEIKFLQKATFSNFNYWANILWIWVCK